MPEPTDPNERKRGGSREPDDEAPVAIGGTSWPSDDLDEQDEVATPFGSTEQGEDVATPPGAEGLDEDAAVHKPGAELATGAACLALAFSTLLPWYGTGFETLSGFSSGTWGPIIFFLGIAGAVIVALRRFNVPLAFPVEHGTVLEGIGWVAVVGIILKRFLRPSPGGFQLGLAEPYFLLFNGLMISLLAAVAVALLAGRLSTGSPFVIRPGWFAGFAGKLGVAILAAAVLAGISFGFFNDPGGEQLGAQTPSDVKRFEGKVPPCMKAIPIPSGAKVSTGIEVSDKETKQLTSCSVKYTLDTTLRGTERRIKSALRRKDIPFQAAANGGRGEGGLRSLVLTEPCGFVAWHKPPKGETNVDVVLSYGPVCQFLPASPGSGP